MLAFTTLYHFFLKRLGPGILAVLAALPAPLNASTLVREPFRGVTHIERTDWPNIPRAVTAHILIVDLEDPGISFRLTEPHHWASADEAYNQPERTLAYLERVNAQIAVNAHFYVSAPGGLLNPRFLAVSNGTRYSRIEGAEAALNIDPANHARIVVRADPGGTTPTYETSPPVLLHNAIGGNERIVFQGQNTANPNDITGNRARTVAGLSQDNRTLIIITVDEGRPESRGITPREAAAMLIEYGVWDGLNFDGGGSTTLAMADPAPRLVNVPSQNPPRAVATSLAIFAAPQETAFAEVRVSPGHAEALLSWEIEEPAPSWVEYGRNPSVLELRSLRIDAPRRQHTALLTGLTAGVSYYYQLVATLSGETVRSELRQFKTVALEMIVDDADEEAEFFGAWNLNSLGTGWGSTYRWASVSSSPTATATFTPLIPLSGRYQVETWYLASANRATNTRFSIGHADGEASIRISQQTLGSTWRNLATNLRFEAGDTWPVTIFNDASGGDVVIADAVRWKLTEAFPLPHGEVPDWWFLHFFPTADLDSGTDLTGNGLTLADEYYLGVVPAADPLNFQFRMTRDPDGTTAFQLFPTYPDRQYRLEASADLVDWEEAPGQTFHRDGDSGRAEIFLPAPDAPRMFYRVRITR